ncbi:hypothetical protein PGTUg99_018792 [Puccinia graminis f. sp. tritici]|uniref:Uncharacterized protein n=1 Tax=Puccinia graminis f. sp. tritici TaxID=56615 RepID=A0A5B0RNB4_PUCGR|nr:hypothetical protein PGTUg99_018792 [Puccinia graminis f. sp. tritici]
MGERTPHRLAFLTDMRAPGGQGRRRIIQHHSVTLAHRVQVLALWVYPSINAVASDEGPAHRWSLIANLGRKNRLDLSLDFQIWWLKCTILQHGVAGETQKK